ncbi:MSMEG_4193 family putative phosphomutase [Occultella glacieicola]|uniref:MSMEG_4193 family putative phosphomutase n=1 Tax=Occultella glacieicola TaxID=2518684 RepID=A0ABY2E472_9MICO|nr:histidine phosphatase family protein [Occultella glacieicola]TDE94834.1 MSMEG_4193 family putative phosphomutase [Occultella glacieicola]
MATLLLVRHGRTEANARGVLAGRTPGVGLDETGRAQARATGARLAPVPLVGVVTSPMLRCEQTAAAVLDARPGGPARPGLRTDDALTECDYGRWQGMSLKELAAEDLWPLVQRQPSAVTFPGGESLPAMQSRAVAAVRRQDAAFEAEHGTGAVWVAVSHGDIIKSVLADALGMHLDLFQRINVGPASVSIVQYTSTRPNVVAVNTDGGDLAWLATTGGAGAAQAAVGGGSGPDGSGPTGPTRAPGVATGPGRLPSTHARSMET